MLNEAKTSRPRLRPKIIMKKYQIMVNNVWFKIIAGKINKIPEFYAIFARQMPDFHNKTTRSRPGRGQNLEAEAKILASRLLWLRGLNITGKHSLWLCRCHFTSLIAASYMHCVAVIEPPSSACCSTTYSMCALTRTVYQNATSFTYDIYSLTPRSYQRSPSPG